MKKFIAKAFLAVLGVMAFLISWGAWSESGSAPRGISASYDALNRIVLRNDPFSRCTRPGKEIPEFVGFRECLDFGPQQTYSGIYISQFEGDQFLEGQKASDVYHASDRVTFLTDERTDLGSLKSRSGPGSAIYEIIFVGRKAAFESPGWIGIMDEVVLADHILTLRKIQSFEGYVPDTVLVQSK